MHDTEQRFREAIVATIGCAPDRIEAGRLQRFATSDRHRDNAGWALLFADGQKGVYGDFRGGLSAVWSASDARAMMTPAERAAARWRTARAQAEREAQLRQRRLTANRWNAALWAQSQPVSEGDPVARYLRSRGLDGPVPAAVRLHPHLPYFEGVAQRGVWPAMVAPLVAPDGYVVALHRTYLTADGCKAPVPTVKKLTGASGPLAGACIPLHDPQQGFIGIAEGIETAQAAHLASGLPTVAAYCAGNLAAYTWPAGVRRIVVFADADPAGAAAAQSLKTRALRAGLSVAVMTPSTPSMDWCDVWAQRGAVAVAASEAAA